MAKDNGVAIRLDGVSKSFGTLEVVNNVTFSVQSGEFFTLLGPSGCGKSTILRLIAGLIPLTRGQIFIDGELANTVPPYKRKTAMVFQNYAVFPHMTVEDNIAFGLKMRGVPRNEIKKQIIGIVELVRLTGLERKYPFQCSGGEQQRIALARALAINPSILLLDEPLSNLDVQLQEHMRFEIKELQNKLGVSTLNVTHNQEEALAMSDTVAVMSRGRIEQIGTPLEIYEHPSNRFVANFVGEINEFYGSVDAIEGFQSLVRLEGSEVVIYCNTHKLNVTIGSRVVVAVRPERITLTEPGVGANGIVARVIDVSSLGRFFRYTSIFANSTFTSIESNRKGYPSFSPGDKVRATWRGTDCLLLDPDEHF